MARRPAKPAPVTPAPDEAPKETEGAVTAPDAPEEAPEEAPHEITIAFPLEPHTAAPEDAPLLVRVDY